MKKIIVLISGGGSNLEAIAKACQTGNIPASIELVISNQSNVKGLDRAKKFHLMSKVIEHQDFNSREEFDQALLEHILPIEPDLVVLAGFMRIIGPRFIDAFEGRVLNLHPSLLPSFKGAHGIREAFEAGVKITGCTVHWVTPDLDAGPVVDQKSVRIDPGDSLALLEKKIHVAEHQLLPNVVARMSQGDIPLPVIK